MTTWVEQAHSDAILSLLGAAPPALSPLMVYDDGVPSDAPDHYVRVYLATSTPVGTSLTSDQDRAVTRAYCHCVGRTSTAARAVAGRVSAALLNITPVIAGRVCFPIRDDGSDSPPRPDEATGVLVMDRLMVFRLESVPG